jgi:signal peptidase I
VQFFKIRKARKELKEILHYAKHVRHMHEDLAAPNLLEQLNAVAADAKAARKSGAGEQMGAAGAAVIQACEKISPPQKHAKIRENVEVLFVAVAAAMAIRAYFFQPFKIPTGSMQPTLYGITVQAEPTIKANNPLAKIANLVLFGERHVVIRAKNSGSLRLHQNSYGTQLDLQTTKSQSDAIFFINDVPHKVPMSLWHKQAEQFLSLVRKNNGNLHEGEVLFNGVLKSGDYILVNRIKYNFVRPKRGDIAVFDTRELTHPQVRKDAYYIKRMVGLPGETISLDPPYLRVNGEKPTDPRFDKIFNNTNYDGYVFGDSRSGPQIGKPGDSITTDDDEYLFFGDNTTLSLDGRYFGPVKRRDILGPAFFVCWPLDRAGFAETSH